MFSDSDGRTDIVSLFENSILALERLVHYAMRLSFRVHNFLELTPLFQRLRKRRLSYKFLFGRQVFEAVACIIKVLCIDAWP